MYSAQDIKTLRDKTGAGMMDCKKALEATSGNIDEAINWLREKGISKAAKKSDRIAAEGIACILTSGNNAVIYEVNSETDFVAKNDEFKNFVSELGTVLLNGNATTMDEALTLPMNGTTVSDALVAIVAKIGEKISFRRFTKVTKNDDEVFGSYSHMGGKIVVLTVLKGTQEAVAKDVAMHICASNPLCISISEVPESNLAQERKIYHEQAINEGKPEEIAAKMVEGRIKKYYKEVCLNEQPFVKDPNVSVGSYVKNNESEIVSMYRYGVGEGIEKKTENFAEEVSKQMKGN